MPRVVGGFTVGSTTPEQVLRAAGLEGQRTVDELVAASAPHDSTNPGYLSRAELELGAQDLVSAAPPPPPSPSNASFDYSTSVIRDIKDQYFPGTSLTDDELVRTAALWDDGNGYLKKKELEAGAMELQITRSGQTLKASDIASIRTWTGCERAGSTPPPPPPPSSEIGVVSDIDKTVMPPETRGQPPPAPYPGVGALFQLLEKGPQGNGALGDVTYVTARSPQRVVDVPGWLANNNLPAGTIETGISSVPWVAEDEKVADIERLFRAHPNQQFVLFGDTNHRDPEVYKRIRDKFPSQVKAVIMHDVKSIPASRVVGHELVKNYAEAAAKLLKLRVVDETGARSVMNAAKREGLAITDAEIDALIAANR